MVITNSKNSIADIGFQLLRSLLVIYYVFTQLEQITTREGCVKFW